MERLRFLFIRGGWNSKEDSYLAVKGGSPLTSHAHMDAGSFIYERKGIRWAIDLGMQNYLSLESRGVNLGISLKKDNGGECSVLVIWHIIRLR